LPTRDGAADAFGLPDEENQAEPVAVAIPAERQADTARSGLYALLASYFLFPDINLLKLLASGDWRTQCNELVDLLPYPLAAAEPGPALDERAVSLTFSRLFDVVQGLPAVSLLERRYGKGQTKTQKKLWEDLLRYYNHFGLEFAEAAAEGGPDHLVNQLEFMHYLSFLQCGSGDAGGDFRRAQRDFLTNHLGEWSSEFALAAQAEPDSEPYSQVAKLLAEFIASDLRYLQTECDRVAATD
jgi:putative dimethyl sulfoxide reductase chaperone